MYAVIAGCGRLGSRLASCLSSEGNDVAVVGTPMDRRRLGNSFDGLTIEGNPIDQEILEQAGIRKADLFVAATSDDNVNAAAAQAATGLFAVPRVIARFMDPERERFYRNLGVDTVCPTMTGLNQILDYIRTGAFSTLGAIVDPDLICVVPREDWIGALPRDIRLPPGRRMLGIARGSRLYGIGEASALRSDDSILIARSR